MPSNYIIISILFLVQFIDVLDFMIVMPLGPDFAKELSFKESNLGWLSAAYTFSAAFSGIVSSKYLDNFDRKKILLITLLGLSIANIFSSLSWNIETIIMSRFLAGTFGGPATSICFAIVADLFTEETRGSVMSKVMSGFSLAAIFGVPIGLKISEVYSWHASFILVAIIGIITTILTFIFLPNITSHIETKNTLQNQTYTKFFNNYKYFIAFLAAFIGSVAAFMIIPYISAYVQLNLSFPRANIDQLFFIGGLASFISIQIAGYLVDKTSSSLITMLSNVFIFFTLIFGFIFNNNSLPYLVVFPAFMIGMASRNVASFTLYTKIANSKERAGFLSIISCVQHIACSAGSILSSIILKNNTGERIENMETVSIISAILFLIVPFFFRYLEKHR